MITISTADLVGVLGDAIPFASRDDDHPTINAVRVEWDGDMLHALATDRYRIAIASWHPDDAPDADAQDDLFTDLGGADDPWRILLPLDDAKALVTTYKLPPREAVAVPLTLEYDTTRDRLKVARARDTGHSAITTVVDGQGGEYPDLRKALSEHDRLTALTGLAFAPRMLADFAKVRQRGPMRLQFTGRSDLTHVSIGERFVGAVQPVRTEERADQP